ncbi:hypothetical protein ACT8ZV_03115 [Nocardioides sp. MAHUQ-72]|uniref:hypothetical protein n=1 Tax=unclassified Nocardioides TaxID=2615069 RepID=UPI00360F55A4
MTKTLAGLAAVSLLLTGALSGCGVAGTDFHPGVAARVGDDTVSVSRVDTVASDYCGAIEKQLVGQGQVVPLRYLRGYVAGQLALVAAARQLGEQYDVGPGAQYDQKVAQLESAVADLPQDQQDAVVEIEASTTYIATVLQAVGEQVLGSQGGKKSAAGKAGEKAFTSWLDEHGVEVDPQFGVAIEDGKAVQTDTSVSYALGDTAVQGDAKTPDTAYAAGLPDSQRCG